MKKRVLFLGSVFLLGLFVLGVFFTFKKEGVGDKRKKLKVGFYEYYPYYYFNKDSKEEGYYNDLLKIISHKLDKNYDYIDCDSVSEVLEKLKEGEIDLAFGITKTEDREDDFSFTDHYINNDNFAVYTNKNIKMGDLNALEGLKMGYIKGEANNEWFLNLLKSKGIEVTLKELNSYPEEEKYLEEGKIDFIVENTRSDVIKRGNNIKKIFEFSTGPVYIVSRGDRSDLIEKIDKVLGDLEEHKDQSLYAKYFSQYANKFKEEKVILILIILIFSLYVYKNKREDILSFICKRKIRNYMKRNNYILYYQPIIEPKEGVVCGFESLLRLKKKDGQILSPYSFIKEIEENNMTLELSLWLLDRALSDYRVIREFEFLRGRDFYISINISFKELEDPRFLRYLMKLSKEYMGEDIKICLEVVEKFAMEDIGRIQSAIRIIKEYGFLIAIDDFGVEYSNLDLLNKIEYDIIKLDKYFADNLSKSLINEKTIKFIAEICSLSEKTIVFEGVETLKQVEIIRGYSYKKVLIQGYFYSKPIDICDLKNFKVRKL